MIMIMEFVEGMTLRAKLASGSILMSQSLDYMRQVLSGLAFAHAKGIVHRDIKPSNIMVTARSASSCSISDSPFRASAQISPAPA